MRKILPSFRVALLVPLLLSLLLPATALAHDFEVDGIYYNINGNEATVTYQGTDPYSMAYSGYVDIPETVTYNGTTYTVTSIGSTAFYGCYNLTSITLPNSLTVIAKYAFEGCTKLSSIEIPCSVNSIGNDAFYACAPTLLVWNAKKCSSNGRMTTSNITQVTIGPEVEELPYGFLSGSQITSLEIPNSVTTIGGRAFSDCSKLTGNITISKFVTSIGVAPFLGCNELTGITVASDNPIYDSRNNCNAIIETSSNKLINGCNSTVIPNSVTSIGDYAFMGFTKFTSIIIPNSVTAFGWCAFYGCTGLTSVTIPSSVTDLGYYAYAECSGLNSLTVASGNPIFDSRDNCNAIIQTASNTLIVGCKNTVFPSSVTSINDGAFNGCTGLTNITIPNSITFIDWCAFLNCTGLTNINIPNSVTTISPYTFEGCSSLTSIKIPSSVTSIGDGAFKGCSSLTSIKIPSSVTSIGHSAFYNCNRLYDVYSYVNPENISMGPRVFEIEEEYYPYEHDYSTRTLYVLPGFSSRYQQDSKWSQYFGHIFEVSSFELDGIYYKFIGDNEVAVTNANNYNHKYTGDIIIPETINFGGVTYTVTAIDEDAFEGCIDLKSVTLPNSITSIGDMAFMGCAKLASINLPNSVTSIGDYAFRNCIKLANISIPNSVTSIGEKAFEFCYRITEITVPESVTTIGLTTFSYCYSLTQVTWNAQNCMLEYTYFDDEDHLPFAYCPSLKKIIIGSEVESIDDEIFCIYDPVYNNIDTVMCLATQPPVITEDCFWFHTYEKATLCVPRASVDSYANAAGWKEFVNRATIATDEDYPGDVDNDGTITIGDVTLLIDYILGTNNHSINSVNADVDGDRYITIGDVTALIDDLLRKN